MPGRLPPIDFLLATALVLIAMNGGRRGFLKESAMLIGLVAGAIAARQLGPLLAGLIWHDDAQWHNLVPVYLSILVLVLLVAVVGASMIRPALNNPALRTVDHVAGLVLGGCEGLLLLGSAALFFARLGFIDDQSSRLGPFFASWVVALMHYVPGDYSSWLVASG
jgi:uncharacterized membrane protein required for colicin V production